MSFTNEKNILCQKSFVLMISCQAPPFSTPYPAWMALKTDATNAIILLNLWCVPITQHILILALLELVMAGKWVESKEEKLKQNFGVIYVQLKNVAFLYWRSCTTCPLEMSLICILLWSTVSSVSGRSSLPPYFRRRCLPMQSRSWSLDL